MTQTMIQLTTQQSGDRMLAQLFSSLLVKAYTLEQGMKNKQSANTREAKILARKQYEESLN